MDNGSLSIQGRGRGPAHHLFIVSFVLADKRYIGKVNPSNTDAMHYMPCVTFLPATGSGADEVEMKTKATRDF